MTHETRRTLRNRVESKEATRPPSTPDDPESLTDKQLEHIEAITAHLDEDEQEAAKRAMAIVENEDEDAPRGRGGLSDGQAYLMDALTGAPEYVPDDREESP